MWGISMGRVQAMVSEFVSWVWKKVVTMGVGTVGWMVDLWGT